MRQPKQRFRTDRGGRHPASLRHRRADVPPVVTATTS
jgi:hypothetical protein